MKEENEALAKKRAQQKRRAARADNRWIMVEKIVGWRNCIVEKIVWWRKVYGGEKCMVEENGGE